MSAQQHTHAKKKKTNVGQPMTKQRIFLVRQTYEETYFLHVGGQAC